MTRTEVMSEEIIHDCVLPISDYSGLPKLAPNASWTERWARNLRRLVMMNLKHSKGLDLFRNEAAMRTERRRHATSPYFFVIHPLSTLSTVLEFMFFIVWFTNLVIEPVVDFSTQENMMINLYIQTRVMTPTRLILIICFFNLGYVHKNTKTIELQPKKIIIRYLKTYFFFDFMTTYIVLMAISHFLPRDNVLLITRIPVIFYMIRIVAAIIRIPTLLQFLDNFLARLKIGSRVRYCICLIIRTFMCLHVLTYIIHKVAMVHYLETNHVSAESWLFQARIYTFPVKTTFQKYFETFILVSAYFFGVSYKFIMTVPHEQTVAVFITLCGRMYTLYLLADVLRLFGIAGISESVFERYMSLLQEYMINQNLPQSLRQRMFMYCKFKFQGRYFKENLIMKTLSEKLRTEVFLFSARKMINKNEVIKRLPLTTLTSLVADMTSETFSARDVIVRAGSEINEVYFVCTGTVAIMSIEGYELGHLEDGEVFGIGCLFFRQQVHTILAVETTEVFIINKNKFIQYLTPYPQVMNAFYRSAKNWLLKMKSINESLATRKIDLLSALQSGEILERRAKRMSAK